MSSDALEFNLHLSSECALVCEHQHEGWLLSLLSSICSPSGPLGLGGLEVIELQGPGVDVDVGIAHHEPFAGKGAGIEPGNLKDRG